MAIKKFYRCDPEKHTGCSKESCKYNPDAKYHDCELTIHKELSIDRIPIEINTPGQNKTHINSNPCNSAMG